MHEPKVHAAIAVIFMRPCLYVSRDVQQEVFEHLAWLSRIVPGVLIGDRDWEHAQTVERRRLDLLVGVVQRVRVRVRVPLVAVSSLAGPMRARRVSSAARRQETRMLKHTCTWTLGTYFTSSRSTSSSCHLLTSLLAGIQYRKCRSCLCWLQLPRQAAQILCRHADCPST